jgi:hypothetical protein
MIIVRKHENLHAELIREIIHLFNPRKTAAQTPLRCHTRGANLQP